MALSVESLIAELGLELASGHESAHAPVRWVHSTELVDPTPWLTGGELLLTTGIQLDRPKLQRELIERLVAHRIAGLGFGVGFTHEKLPTALLNAARKLDFPVFEVPYELPFIAITERASAHLVSEQYQTLRRGVQVQERMERLVLEERGLQEVVRVAAGAIGGVVGVLDAHGGQLAWHAHVRALRDSEMQAIAREIREAGTIAPSSSPPAPFEPRLPRWQGGVLALPVIARDRAAPHAWLVGARAGGELEEFEQLILRQTVTVVALELMHLRIEHDTERRLAGDVLAEALTGRLHPEELQARLLPFGIGEQAAVLAFSLRDPDAAAPLLEQALARADVHGLVATRAGHLCAAIDAPPGTDPIAVASAAREDLAGQVGEVRASASRGAATHSLRLSFHEARCALEAVRLQNGRAPEVASHRDLGAFQLLLSLQDDDALISYCRGVLGPVEQGEGDYGDELLRSLDVFIEHNGHWEKAATALYCHRHTLRYRIRRVEQLTGRDFGKARDRIEFWLALRGRELAR
ncbi:MAG TPA: PucR family transcriptional regulator ligand-binding domain-containing protein [Solirubrobacteraceae bacterium]|jgi:purine catabolism regulator